MHENRETSEAPEVNTHDRPVGEGNSRTAHVHASEESDSGAVPMNHLNKDGKPLAEGEEGRPLVKENTHQSSTHSTLSEVRVSQGSLRANIDETTPSVVITEQGENRNQSEEQWNRFGFPHGFAHRGT